MKNFSIKEKLLSATPNRRLALSSYAVTMTGAITLGVGCIFGYGLSKLNYNKYRGTNKLLDNHFDYLMRVNLVGLMVSVAPALIITLMGFIASNHFPDSKTVVVPIMMVLILIMAFSPLWLSYKVVRGLFNLYSKEEMPLKQSRKSVVEYEVRESVNDPEIDLTEQNQSK